MLKDYTFQTGYDAARRMLEKPGRPTALVCLSDLLGAGALRVAHEMGLLIPEDLSVVGMGNLMASQIVWPALTTVAIPTVEMAAKAADMLLDQIMGVDVSPEAVFETRLIARESSGPAPD